MSLSYRARDQTGRRENTELAKPKRAPSHDIVIAHYLLSYDSLNTRSLVIRPVGLVIQSAGYSIFTETIADMTWRALSGGEEGLNYVGSYRCNRAAWTTPAFSDGRIWCLPCKRVNES